MKWLTSLIKSLNIAKLMQSDKPKKFKIEVLISARRDEELLEIISNGDLPKSARQEAEKELKKRKLNNLKTLNY
jgi:hypothetical protein